MSGRACRTRVIVGARSSTKSALNCNLPEDLRAALCELRRRVGESGSPQDDVLGWARLTVGSRFRWRLVLESTTLTTTACVSPWRLWRASHGCRQAHDPLPNPYCKRSVDGRWMLWWTVCQNLRSLHGNQSADG